MAGWSAAAAASETEWRGLVQRWLLQDPAVDGAAGAWLGPRPQPAAGGPDRGRPRGTRDF
eukprot:4885039-Pyramimonas_sp.AAC.1